MTSPAPVFQSTLETIGNTPLVKVANIDTGPCELYLKLENQNPGGSIKDRIGRSMIEQAEKDGRLRPGGTIVEGTAGNTGLGLAIVAAQKGYRLIVVVPDKMAQEKIFHLKALGAEVHLTRSDVGKGHPEYYQDMAERIAREEDAFFVHQFANPANPLAHETTTGPEIWAQMDGRCDAVVCGVGSGGTLTGLSRYFEKVAPDLEMVVADPEGSVVAPYVRTGEMPNEVGSWIVEGIGEDFLPPILDLSRCRSAYEVPDREALLTARELLKKEGLLCGSSSGTLIAGALRYCREQTAPKRVVTFVCDSGNKYLTKQFNDYWMIDQGFIERERVGDLRDIIGRPHDERSTVLIGQDDTLIAAHGRMKLYDVSQLPVLDSEGKVVGLVDEEDILLAVVRDEASFTDPVRTVMSSRLDTITPDRPMEELINIFSRGHVAIVMQDSRFYGLITRIDLLNHLRRKMK
jgi:cystathionine beta-synthase